MFSCVLGVKAPIIDYGHLANLFTGDLSVIQLYSQQSLSFSEYHPFQGVACSPMHNIIFSSVYHISILSVPCIFIACFLSRSFIPSVHTIGSIMDPSGLIRGPSSLLDGLMLMSSVTPLAVRCTVGGFTYFMVR